jgi:transposase-like protein
MRAICCYCPNTDSTSENRSMVVRDGYYKRKSDGRKILRLRCRHCRRYFSLATFNQCYRQNKRRLNDKITKLLCSGVSQRRIAKLLKISRTTVARKLIFLGEQAKIKLLESNFAHPSSKIIEFDDLETFEHTKCKPLSVTLALVFEERRFLGFEVSKMPAKGHLAKIAMKKYGPRKDERAVGRQKLFSKIEPFVHPFSEIKSDQNPYYPRDVKRHFPFATHTTLKGQRGSSTGQGELKKVRFDPLFSLNHTCAMLRANINRLARKTWCTTKNPARLEDHIAIYAVFHNLVLLNSA